MSRRPVYGMLLLLLLSSLSPVLTPLPAADEEIMQAGESTSADFVVPAGADLAFFLDLGPSELDDALATAEVDGLFDDLAYEPTAYAVEDVELIDGYACALTIEGSILCFQLANGGQGSLLGQNRSDVWGTYYQGNAPLPVAPEVGQAWTSLHAGRGGDSEWFCACLLYTSPSPRD